MSAPLKWQWHTDGTTHLPRSLDQLRGLAEVSAQGCGFNPGPDSHSRPAPKKKWYLFPPDLALTIRDGSNPEGKFHTLQDVVISGTFNHNSRSFSGEQSILFLSLFSNSTCCSTNGVCQHDTDPWSTFNSHWVMELLLLSQINTAFGACLQSLGGLAWVKRSLQTRVKIDLVHKTASRQRAVSKLPLAFIGLPFSCCRGTCRC